MVTISKFEPKSPQGLVVILTGNGKGKTTSSMGMALRGCGHGLRTTIVQFMKGDLYSGEWGRGKKTGSSCDTLSHR
jgi:cob(I)alamin adenosyltransferase